MSTTIESHVVEMRFNNSDFEKNAKQSMTTLEKLKSLLDKGVSAKSMEDLGAATTKCTSSFDGFSTSVSTITTKFSALEIAGVTALVNITNRAVEAGIQLAKSLSIDNIAAGFTKFEEKTQSVATLLAQGYNLDVVNEQLDKLAWYTDETSYNFTDMVSNISKFTATGQDLETSVTAMEGIANWAALSGQNAQKASQAMYQLSQAMSKGALKYDDWKSISNASMDTIEFRRNAAEAAVELGQLKKKGEDSFETISGKVLSLNELFSADYMSKQAWFTSDVMMKVFEQYGSAIDPLYEAVESGKYDTASEAIQGMGDSVDEFGLKAFKAAQEARTWTDVVDSVKDAVSSGWMKTFELIFGDAEEATKLWTDMANSLWDIFAGGAEGRNEFISEMVTPSWDKLKDKISDTGVDLDTFEEKLISVARNHGVAIDDMIKDCGSFKETLKKGWLTDNLFSDAIDAIINDNSKFVDSNGAVVKSLEEYQKVVNDVIKGNYGNGVTRVQKLTEAGYEYEQIQSLVNKQLKEGKFTLDELSDAQLEATGLTEEQIAALKELQKEANESGTSIDELIKTINKPTARDLAIESIMNILEGISQRIGLVREAWAEIFPPEDIQNKIYNILERFNQLTESFIANDEKADKLKRTYKGLFAALDIVGQAFGAVAHVISSVLSLFTGTGNAVLDTTASLGDYVVALDKSIRENQTFIKIADKIVNVLKIVVKYFREGVDAVKNFFKNFSESDEFKNFYELLKEKVNKALEEFNDFCKDANEYLKKLFDRVNEFTNGKLATWLDKIKSFISNFKLSSIIDGVKSLKEHIVELTNSFIEFIKTGDTTSLVNSFNNIWTAVTSKFGPAIDFIVEKLRQLAPLLITGGVLWGLKQLVSVIKSILNFGDSLSGMFGSITGAFNSLKKVFGGIQFIEIATGILILVGALYALSKIPHEDLKQASLTLLSIGVGLGLLALGIGAMNKWSQGSDKAAFGILGITAGIGIMVAALIAIDKELGQQTLNQLIKDFNILISIMVLVGVVATIMSKIAPQMSVGGIGIITFAGALYVIVKTLEAVADPETTEKLYTGLKGMVPVLTTMLGLATIMRIAGKGGKSAGIGMILLAGSIIAIVKALNWLAENPIDFKTLEENIASVITVLGVMVGFAAVMRLSGDSGSKVGFGFLALAASMVVIAKAMQMLAQINKEDVLKVAALTAELGAIVSAMLYCSQYAKDIKTGPIIAMAVVLGVIGFELAALSIINPKQLLSASTAIFEVLLGFAACLKTAQGQIKFGNMLEIGEMIAALIVIAMQIAKLAEYDWKSLLAAGTALSEVMVALGLACMMINEYDSDFKSAVANCVNIIALLAAMGAATLYISELAKYDWKGLLGAGTALSLVVVSIGAACALMNIWSTSIEEGASNFLTLCGFGIAIMAIGDALSKICGYDWESIMAATISISALLIVIAGLSVGLGALQALIGAGNIILGGVLLDVLMGLVELFLGLSGYLVEITGSEKYIKTGLDVINLIATSMAETVGEMISSFGEGLTSKLPQIGTNLSDFIKNLDGFYEGISKIPDNSADKIKILVESLILLGEAELIASLDRVINMFTGGNSFKDTFEQLSDSVDPLVSFINDVSNGVSLEAVQKVKDIFSALTELMKEIEPQGGILKGLHNVIYGDDSIDGFIRNMLFSIDLLEQLSAKSNGLDTQNLDNFIISMRKIITLARLIADSGYASGGLKQVFTGSSSIQTFCKNLSNAGIEVRELSDYGESIVVENVNNFCAAIRSLATLESVLTEKHGGLKAAIAGEDTIQKFCENLRLSAYDVKELSKNSSEDVLNVANIRNFCAAIRSLVTLEDVLTEKHGGLWQSISGDDSIQNFAKGLNESAQELAILSNLSEGINIESVDKFVYCIKRLTSITTNDLSLASLDMTTLSYNLQIFVETTNSLDTETLNAKMQEFKDALSTIDSKTIDEFKLSMEKLATTSIQSFCDEFTNSQTLINNAIKVFLIYAKQALLSDESIIQAFIDIVKRMLDVFTSGEIVELAKSRVISLITIIKNTITSKADDFKRAGVTCAKQYASGLSSEESISAAKNSAQRVAQTVIDAIKNPGGGDEQNGQNGQNEQGNGWFQLGVYCMEGFMEGMTSKIPAIQEKAREIARKALEEAKSELGVQSPSREFMKVGRYVGEGFVIGMNSYIDRIKDTGSDIGLAALQSTNDVINGIRDVIDDSMDLNPTITPILDLSNVKNGANSISSMFNSSRLAASVEEGGVDNIQNRGNGVNGVTFVQNNYSPKSLSRIEIYRQTNNQIAMLKGALT